MLHDVVQRLRVTFAISEPLTYISVVDLGRTWERLLNRSDVPVAFSQGFNPHARLTFAAALPVGYASEGEMVDVLLGREMPPDGFLAATRDQLPNGLRLLKAETVDIKAKPLQALMQEARYAITIYCSASQEAVDATVATFLARKDIPRERRKKKGRISTYNMRPLVLDLTRTKSCSAWHRLELRVRCGNQGSGRPEEVVQELGLPVSQYTIVRTELVWNEQDATQQEETAS